MNIPRFFINPKYINTEEGTVFCQDAKLAKQIRKVLRLGNGDRLDILDSQGYIYHCILQISPKQSRDCFQAIIEKQEKLPVEKKPQLIVALPLIKIHRFEWALEKLTELGVDKIVPIALHRSIVKLPPNNHANNKNDNDSNNAEHHSKFLRWQKIIQEASEQCERPTPPHLVAPLSFKDWLENDLALDLGEANTSLRIICAERQDVQPLELLLCNQTYMPSTCAIALGAEGGFTEEEFKLALRHQFTPVSLGTRILRTETAAIYTLSIVNALLRLIQKTPSAK